MEKVLQELFGRTFLGAHTVQTVLKYIWMWQLCIFINHSKGGPKILLFFQSVRILYKNEYD